MANLDKTGPNGEGPKTGRCLGNCIDENICNNGARRRCCRNINKNFYQTRLNRMKNNNNNNN